MKVQGEKDLANHSGPKSCEGGAEALIGKPAGQSLSREIRDADAVKRRKATGIRALTASPGIAPRSARAPA